MREEGFGTALGSLFGVLFLGQLLLLLVFATEGGLGLLKEQTDLRLEILDSAEDSQIQDLFQNIRQLPYVEETVYITKEQAYERQKQRDPDLILFLGKFGIDNPFPETIGVRLKKLTDYPQFIEFLKQPVFTKVVNPAFLSETTDQEQQVYRIIGAVQSAEYVLFFVMAIVLLAILFVIVELVRRRALAKREELFVEQLVGAGPLGILVPFGTEMVCLLALALAFSVALTAVIVLFLPLLLPALGSEGLFGVWTGATLQALASSLLWLLPLEFFLMLLLAVGGTAFALRSRMSMQILPLLPST